MTFAGRRSMVRRMRWVVCRIEPGARVARRKRLEDPLNSLPGRGAIDEGVFGHSLLSLEGRAVPPTVDVHGQFTGSPAHRARAAASETKLPPSLAQRSASRRASEAARAATAIAGSGLPPTCAPPTSACSVVRGPSDAHWVPHRQQASSWRAIGARQERHTRGKCRSRMTQRSLVRDGTGDPLGSILSFVSISATFPSARITE
jgi:hypothetical protein